MIKETLLYDKLASKKVRCNICQRRCTISPGKMGYCFTRENRDGRLYTLIYGEVSTRHIAPIEIKPLFHFYPGSRWFSLGTLGCNFRCLGCQNWEIAHYKLRTLPRGPRVPSGREANSRSEAETPTLPLHARRGELRTTKYISPEEVVRLAKKSRCKGLSFTYNEPTIWFEYTLDCARLAKKKGLLSNYVTNGYITPEALDTIGPYLAAFRVDIKGFSDKFYKWLAKVSDFKGILEVTKRAKDKWGMHIEIVTNIIPGHSDDEGQLKGIANWIYKNLGEDTPWHVTRFIPYLQLSHLSSTPVATLEKAQRIGKEAGLKFVYLGNVPGHELENTYCPKCGRLLIRRLNYSILEYHIEKGKCNYCQEPIPIIEEGGA